ncbi:MAG TPA: methylamine utilization protein [Pirellulales bacterium]
MAKLTSRNSLACVICLTVFSLTVVSGGAGTVSAQWGNLKGQFIYNGKAPEPKKLDTTKEPVCVPHNLVDESLLVAPDGGIKNVVIFVRTKKADLKINPALGEPPAQIEIDNKNCRFEPHLLVLQVGQTLLVKNSDPFSHNSNVTEIGGQGANPLIAPGKEATYKYVRSQMVPQPVACNIHPWMRAFVLPRDNPYFAVSSADGKFEIKDLPVGKLEFQVWQEKAGNVDTKEWPKGRFTMDIKAGDNDLGTVKLDPKLFNK